MAVAAKRLAAPIEARARAIPGMGQGFGSVAVVVAVAVAAVAGGCNWTTFSDDAKKAPVRSIGAPSTFKAQDFGRSLLPLSDGQGKAAAFVASGINDTNVALITVDVAGGVTTASVPGSALNDTEQSVISSLAEDAGNSPLRLILGSPKVHNQGYGRVYTYLLSPMLDQAVSTLPVPALPDEPGLGRGLATGHLAGADAKSDIVVASDDNILVMVDGDASSWTALGVTGTGCSTLFTTTDARDRLRRALVTARLWTDPSVPAGQQLVAGLPSSAGGAPGSVSFFSVTGSGTTFGLNCLASATAPKPEMRARFGVSLATGDFNGDGQADLVVGAPERNAYVYLGPFPGGAVPAPIVISDSEGVDFGYAVTALDVDGNPGDEVLVADPYATVNGKTHAGRVTAYTFNSATGMMDLFKVYQDHSPDADANFGSTVNALKFCTASPSPAAGVACPEAATSRVLLVGAANEVFLYYRVGANLPSRPDGDKTVLDVRAP